MRGEPGPHAHRASGAVDGPNPFEEVVGLREGRNAFITRHLRGQRVRAARDPRLGPGTPARPPTHHERHQLLLQPAGEEHVTGRPGGVAPAPPPPAHLFPTAPRAAVAPASAALRAAALGTAAGSAFCEAMAAPGHRAPLRPPLPGGSGALGAAASPELRRTGLHSLPPAAALGAGPGPRCGCPGAGGSPVGTGRSRCGLRGLFAGLRILRCDDTGSGRSPLPSGPASSRAPFECFQRADPPPIGAQPHSSQPITARRGCGCRGNCRRPPIGRWAPPRKRRDWSCDLALKGPEPQNSLGRGGGECEAALLGALRARGDPQGPAHPPRGEASPCASASSLSSMQAG